MRSEVLFQEVKIREAFQGFALADFVENPILKALWSNAFSEAGIQLATAEEFTPEESEYLFNVLWTPFN